MTLSPTQVAVGDQFVWNHPKLGVLSGQIVGTTEFCYTTDNAEVGADGQLPAGRVSKSRWLTESAAGRIRIIRHKPLPQPTPPCGTGEGIVLAA